MLQDLINLIDERMGKLENRATRMHLSSSVGAHRDAAQDARFGFMFENANVGGDTMGEILTHLFRLEPNGQPMTVMQVAGCRPRWSTPSSAWSAGSPSISACGATARCRCCSSARRRIASPRPTRPSASAPTRRALLRIAKEGRKYGVYLGLVTQRPAELDPTIISQCNTLFAMRMANERDQALLRSAVTDAVANLLAFVPSLGTREVVAFGEGMPLPARLTFKAVAADRVPRSETFERADFEFVDGRERAFVKLVVDRWRGAAGGPKADRAKIRRSRAPSPRRRGAAVREPAALAAELTALRGPSRSRRQPDRPDSGADLQAGRRLDHEQAVSPSSFRSTHGLPDWERGLLKDAALRSPA